MKRREYVYGGGPELQLNRFLQGNGLVNSYYTSLPTPLPSARQAVLHEASEGCEIDLSPRAVLFNDISGLEKCYKRICKDDVLPLHLLLQNQHILNTTNIQEYNGNLIQTRYQPSMRMSPDGWTHEFVKNTVENQEPGEMKVDRGFPQRKPPFVPTSFLGKKGSRYSRNLARYLPKRKQVVNDLAFNNNANQKVNMSRGKQTSAPARVLQDMCYKPFVVPPIPDACPDAVYSATTNGTLNAHKFFKSKPASQEKTKKGKPKVRSTFPTELQQDHYDLAATFTGESPGRRSPPKSGLTIVSRKSNRSRQASRLGSATSPLPMNPSPSPLPQQVSEEENKFSFAPASAHSQSSGLQAEVHEDSANLNDEESADMITRISRPGSMMNSRPGSKLGGEEIPKEVRIPSATDMMDDALSIVSSVAIPEPVALPYKVDVLHTMPTVPEVQLQSKETTISNDWMTAMAHPEITLLVVNEEGVAEDPLAEKREPEPTSNSDSESGRTSPARLHELDQKMRERRSTLAELLVDHNELVKQVQQLEESPATEES